jgi:hypothetical protein
MRPLILVTSAHSAKGTEFGDAFLSLSRRYALAVLATGGLPLALTHSESREIITACRVRCD